MSELSCVKVDDDLPLDKAVLVGCGVPTGWGSAVYPPGVGPGDTAVIYGIGGIGINSVQGAAHAGASNVVAVDPLPMKRERAEELGATHSFEQRGAGAGGGPAADAGRRRRPGDHHGRRGRARRS